MRASALEAVRLAGLAGLGQARRIVSERGATLAGLYYGRSTGDSYRRCIYRCVGRGALRAVDMGWSVLSASRSSCCLRVLKGRGVGQGSRAGEQAWEQGRGAGQGSRAGE